MIPNEPTTRCGFLNIPTRLFNEGLLTSNFSTNKFYGVVSIKCIPIIGGDSRLLVFYRLIGPRHLYPPTLPSYPSEKSHFYIVFSGIYTHHVPLNAVIQCGLENCLKSDHPKLGRQILSEYVHRIYYMDADEYCHTVKKTVSSSGGIYIASDPRVYEELPDHFEFLVEVDPNTVIYDENMP